MSFTAAYLEIEATYLVPGALAAADGGRCRPRGRARRRSARANYELFLSRNLQHARLVSAEGGDAAFDLLTAARWTRWPD